MEEKTSSWKKVPNFLEKTSDPIKIDLISIITFLFSAESESQSEVESNQVSRPIVIEVLQIIIVLAGYVLPAALSLCDANGETRFAQVSNEVAHQCIAVAGAYFCES